MKQTMKQTLEETKKNLKHVKNPDQAKEPLKQPIRKTIQIIRKPITNTTKPPKNAINTISEYRGEEHHFKELDKLPCKEVVWGMTNSQKFEVLKLNYDKYYEQSEPDDGICLLFPEETEQFFSLTYYVIHKKNLGHKEEKPFFQMLIGLFNNLEDLFKNIKALSIIDPDEYHHGYLFDVLFHYIPEIFEQGFLVHSMSPERYLTKVDPPVTKVSSVGSSSTKIQEPTQVFAGFTFKPTSFKLLYRIPIVMRDHKKLFPFTVRDNPEHIFTELIRVRRCCSFAEQFKCNEVSRDIFVTKLIPCNGQIFRPEDYIEEHVKPAVIDKTKKPEARESCYLTLLHDSDHKRNLLNPATNVTGIFTNMLTTAKYLEEQKLSQEILFVCINELLPFIPYDRDADYQILRHEIFQTVWRRLKRYSLENFRLILPNEEKIDDYIGKRFKEERKM